MIITHTKHAQTKIHETITIPSTVRTISPSVTVSELVSKNK